MAISSYKVFLMHKVSGNYEKLVDIKSYPDLGGTPEVLETTTLSDRVQTNILGIQSLDALEFEMNYTLADYQKLVALEKKNESYAVWFGGTDNGDGTVTPTGEDGKFAFDGELTVWVSGGGVNEVVNMTCSIAASTVIALTT